MSLAIGGVATTTDRIEWSVKMIRELTPELAEIAKRELNEKPNQIQDNVKHLKDWISKQPHLKARTDDQWLVGMLRGCKYSLERVKRKLDLYYTLRTKAPEVTLRIKPTDVKFLEFFKLGTCVILPKPKDKLMPRVILIRPGAYDPSKDNVADIMCVLYYLVQILIIEDDVATVLGTKIMVDYENVTMNHFMQGTPSMLKKMIAVCQDSMPLRLKGSHHINLPSGIEKIFTLISGLLNEKAKERLKIYKQHEELFQEIPKEIIPQEYGGAGGRISEIIDYWAAKITEYEDWMLQEVQLGTDESKRQGPPPINLDLGMNGSFRQLEID
ncbi:hypothetical protein K1T71_002459 [Dendrolimus kikuchii]|uniref:Uncharacterized protein n=1 Tax=Dendrolimus kikuchii TaxID=765133 RepID=A0ACC1DDS4_9NEOP|nr:hypothetical protein K1T71_002459 [Dendrolimus kikuchii]